VIRKKGQKEPLGETEGATGRDRGNHKEETDGATKKRQKGHTGGVKRSHKEETKGVTAGETKGATKERQKEPQKRDRRNH
jgi:hypothetical protein